MVTLLGCKTYQTLAIQAYLIIMYQIGILGFVHATGREIDDTSLLIHMLNATHIILTFRHLTYQLSFLSVIQIDMVTSVTLTGPNDPFTILQIDAALTVIVDILVVFLLNKRSYQTCFRREFQYTIGLMTTFVEFKRHMFVVCIPTGSSHLILTLKQIR